MDAANNWGWDVLRSSPKLFGNAMPKSGSHLLTQVMVGLTEVAPFVNPGYPPVNRTEDNQPVSPGEMADSIVQMKSGDIRYGYLVAREPFLSALSAPDRATIFIYRDPRDLIVSHVFYATDMYEDHGMHEYYNQQLSSMEERINAAILGVNNGEIVLPGVIERYRNYLDWLKQPGVLSIRFEDMILHREIALGSILDYLVTRGLDIPVDRSKIFKILKNAIQPKKSGTFRKGEPGNWKNHFTDMNVETFKRVTGDLLVDLGYEINENW